MEFIQYADLPRHLRAKEDFEVQKISAGYISIHREDLI